MRERDGDRERDRQTKKAVGADQQERTGSRDHTGKNAAKRGKTGSHVRERKVRSPRVGVAWGGCVCVCVCVCVRVRAHTRGFWGECL